jgi:hypothetical protein
VIEFAALQMVHGVLTGWLDRREREAIAYLIEENRLLRRQLGGRRLRLTDDDRRRLAARAYRVGRAAPREIATIATLDTLLRWLFFNYSSKNVLIQLTKQDRSSLLHE